MVCPTVDIYLLASWLSSPAGPRSVGRCLLSSPAPVPQAIGPLRVARCAPPSRHPPLLPRRYGVPHARRLAICRLATPCRSVNRIEGLAIPSLSHVAPSGVSERFSELLGFRQSPCPCLLVPPSRTEAPSLCRRYPASSVLQASPPPRRPRLVLADSRLARARHRRGFPCCCCLSLARMPPSIPRRNRSVLVSLASRPLPAFPEISTGRLPR